MQPAAPHLFLVLVLVILIVVLIIVIFVVILVVELLHRRTRVPGHRARYQPILDQLPTAIKRRVSKDRQVSPCGCSLHTSPRM